MGEEKTTVSCNIEISFIMGARSGWAQRRSRSRDQRRETSLAWKTTAHTTTTKKRNNDAAAEKEVREAEEDEREQQTETGKRNGRVEGMGCVWNGIAIWCVELMQSSGWGWCHAHAEFIPFHHSTLSACLEVSKTSTFSLAEQKSDLVGDFHISSLFLLYSRFKPPQMKTSAAS